MADASKTDQVRAGMEMLAWSYDATEWAEQLKRRIEEIAEVLWRKTEADGTPPRWPDG